MVHVLSSTALIVGASRGIGLGLVREYLSRGWKVIATERTPKTGSELSRLASDFKGQLSVLKCDISRSDEMRSLADQLEGLSLDVLVINAGISDDPKQTISEISTDEFVNLMVTNALSPLRSIEILEGHVKADGSIAVMSSALASISSNTEGGFEAYRASKSALNMLLRSYAVRAGARRSILALMPGWVRTDMGGADAPVTVEQSASGLVDTIQYHQGRPGIYFVDFENKPIAW